MWHLDCIWHGQWQSGVCRVLATKTLNLRVAQLWISLNTVATAEPQMKTSLKMYPRPGIVQKDKTGKKYMSAQAAVYAGKYGMHVFWTCTCFLDLAFFWGDLGARKMWKTCMCVSWTLQWYFLWTWMNLCWTWRNSFEQRGYLFLTPVSVLWTRAPALWTLLPRGGAGDSIVICAHIGLDVFLDLGAFFWTWYMFSLDLAEGGWNLDIETRCTHEIRILKQ